MSILSLEKYKELNEDFYNPFDEADESAKKEPTTIKDSGGSFEKKKESFNLSRVEWSKRPGGGYTVIAKTQFARGEVIEICPLIILGEEAKTIERLKDIIFEIDTKKGEWGLVLGYGSLYSHSDKPNIEFAYNKRQKHMFFIAKRPIQLREELTIDYGKQYWQERSNLNLMATIPNVSNVKDETILKPELEESEIQPGMVDQTTVNTAKSFAKPNDKSNPVVSGVAIIGLGQQ